MNLARKGDKKAALQMLFLGMLSPKHGDSVQVRLNHNKIYLFELFYMRIVTYIRVILYFSKYLIKVLW